MQTFQGDITGNSATVTNLTITSATEVGQAWTTPSFSAGNFTALAGTWTVEEADVTTYAYIITGKMMTVSFVIETTTITLGTERLYIKIPNSKVATKAMYTNLPWLLDNGVVVSGRCKVDAGGTLIQILPDLGTFTGGTNNNGVYGQITFEIN